MSSNEPRICEYFMISGFNKTRKPYDLSQIYHQGEEIVNTNVEITEDFFHYKAPVVDIQIANGNSIEKLSRDGYHVVDKTYSKLHKADLYGKASVDELYLCFRLGRDRPPITDIWAFMLKQKSSTGTAPEHWTVLERTVDGHSANLNSSSSNALFIGYKRAPENAPVDNLAVTDICIILRNKNELCPPAYSRVDVPIKRTPLSHTINICFKKSMVKQHVLSFQPETLYCLPCTSTEPIVDVFNPDPYKVKSELPEDICDVANFCMPWGATLEAWSVDRSIPKPSFLTFVLTNINYNRMYGGAILFYEEIDRDKISPEEFASLGLSSCDQSKMRIYCNKSLCLLSRWPLFQTFNQVLSFLIQEADRQKSGKILDSLKPLSESDSITNYYSLPIETHISQFLHSVAFPTPQAPNILLEWDPENPIGIQLPTDAQSRFGTGEYLYYLVRILDVEQIIQLFVYMLTEQKILLTSTCNSDLTGIAEALIAMIFPFKWSVVYIPFLYLRCIHIIQSPSPYLIGVDSRFFDFFRLPDGVGCVDLVTKSIKPPDTNCKYLDYAKVLPKSVLKALRTGLTNAKTKVTSFEKQQNLRNTTGKVMHEFTILRKRESIGELIRETFLRAVILLFKNYQAYLIPLSFRQKHNDMFNVEGFLKSVDRNCRILYQSIFETQLWNNFILERSYATEFDDGLAFFDRCMKSMRDLDDDAANAMSLLQTDSVIQSEHTKVIPRPDKVSDWLPDTSRRSFPNRLCSELMLSHSIHAPVGALGSSCGAGHVAMGNGAGDNVGGKENGIGPHGGTDGIAVTPHHSGAASNIGRMRATPASLLNEVCRHEHGSSASLTTAVPDSSIPVLQIRHDAISLTALNTVGSPGSGVGSAGGAGGIGTGGGKATMLKRPFEEHKQARLMGKAAKEAPRYEWAGHVLSSAYCLWFLSLPGLLGHIEDTAGLRRTGLTERILQLALELLDSLCALRFALPDEVCYRVLLVLIHQLRPLRLKASELLQRAELNAFSYGLCNQIILEQEQHSQLLSQSNATGGAGVGNSSFSPKPPVVSTESVSAETGQSTTNDDIGSVIPEMGIESRVTEKDNDSGRATIASASLAPEEAQDSSDSGCNVTAMTTISTLCTTPVGDSTGGLSNNHFIEIGGKSVHLRGRHQTARNYKDRVSQLIIHQPHEQHDEQSPLDTGLFDRNAGIIMSATGRPSALSNSPILALYRSPALTTDTDQSDASMGPKQSGQADETEPGSRPDGTGIVSLTTNTDDSTVSAIISRTPFSEERSELHASFLAKKRRPPSGPVATQHESALSTSVTGDNSYDNHRDLATTSPSDPIRSRMSDSRLTQSDFGTSGGDKVALKSKLSFRQWKIAANKSFRSMKDMMGSVGLAVTSHAASSVDGAVTPGTEQRGKSSLPAGLPPPYQPWKATSAIGKNSSYENRLKTTASADLLDVIGNHQNNVAEPRVCAGTVQQLRKHNNYSGVHWPNSESCESFYSDQKFDQHSSSTSLDTEPQYAIVDKVYDRITGALGAIRLPTGKYWTEENVDSDSTVPPCTECSQSVSVLMTTATECDTCHQSVYDDDIMNGWSSDDSDLQSLCPYCSQSGDGARRFTPKLSFQVYICPVASGSADHPRLSVTAPSKSALAYSSSVNYLSPFVLRKELESVLLQEGEAALLTSNFLVEHGILYWNLVWYYSRLGLPTQLLAFLTDWLRKKGRALCATSAENDTNRDKYRVLLDLTGFEKVIVQMFWEFSQVHGRVGLPLYRKHFRDIVLGVGSSPGQVHRPTEAIIRRIGDNDLYGAVCAVLELRSLSRRDAGGVSMLPLVTCERSVYRELFFLITVVFEARVSYDVFHSMFDEIWPEAKKNHQLLVKSHDRPPSEKTLFCRRFFRPLQLSLY